MPIQDQQLSNKQHAVPQNIMDVEFKLIGDLTMRQFVYLAVFAVIAYMAKLSVPQPFTWFFVIGLALTGLGLAFIPFEERGLDEWIVNFLQAINSPTLRVWRKETELPKAFAFEQNIHIVQQELITLAPTASRRKLEEYLHQKDEKKEEDSLDIPEEEYRRKVREAFADIKDVQETGKPKQTPDIQARQKTEQKIDATDELQKSKLSTPSSSESEKPSEDKTKADEKIKQQSVQVQEQERMARLIQSRIKKSKLRPLDEGKSRKEQPLRPTTSHSGRKFVNLTPTQGKIILPIRGERVLMEEDDIGNSYTEKTKKLESMLDKEKEDERKAMPRAKQIPSMVKKPNIISGIVKNRQDKTLEGVILVIRNEKGEPVRALKTDKLGKFFISSPLPNGKYQIEVEKQGYSFDIIPFEVQGGLLPSYEIIGY